VDDILTAISAAYTSQRQSYVTGAFLLIVLYYAIGAVTYFIFRHLRDHRFSPRSICKIRVRDLLKYLIRRDWHISSPTARVDRCTWLLWQIYGSLVNPIALTGGVLFAVYIAGLTSHYFGKPPPLIHNRTLLEFVQGTALFLVRNLVEYIYHWGSHNVPVLWAFHRVHHTAEQLSIVSGTRVHPVESAYQIIASIILAGPLCAPIFYLTGTKELVVTLPILLLLGQILSAIEVCQHSHVPISFGKLNYIISSPIMHQVHHSMEVRHFGKNLGTFTHIWDWLFGTIYVPKPGEKWRFGLDERQLEEKNPHNTIGTCIFEPFIYAWSSLRGQDPENIAERLARAQQGPRERLAHLPDTAARSRRVVDTMDL
jgi:sterol desaturase/sphingolipid hydroxylase (fatty acid hydroxylase superfamily)